MYDYDCVDMRLPKGFSTKLLILIFEQLLHIHIEAE